MEISTPPVTETLTPYQKALKWQELQRASEKMVELVKTQRLVDVRWQLLNMVALFNVLEAQPVVIPGPDDVMQHLLAGFSDFTFEKNGLREVQLSEDGELSIKHTKFSTDDWIVACSESTCDDGDPEVELGNGTTLDPKNYAEYKNRKLKSHVDVLDACLGILAHSPLGQYISDLTTDGDGTDCEAIFKMGDTYWTIKVA